ncbi:MAG: hypothetical protein AVDCRST_MAG12-2463 [uncultured Rubrobacteraceae bacterium]|uniref:Uncharacterized protein n=1 Tax=uncultured Rubrobacteraceae bacterium TaxID=349277 RepID=A0A6J4SFA0_9ACTN|nr:MAG: hypothetical protein AVDCRST_MAG12-2463 [uncultured Rubrobacteraceae bacterium]
MWSSLFPPFCRIWQVSVTPGVSTAVSVPDDVVPFTGSPSGSRPWSHAGSATSRAAPPGHYKPAYWRAPNATSHNVSV